MKDPKKVEAGKRLAAQNRKKRELKEQSRAKSGVNQYYGIGAVIAVGVIGGLGYYIYRTKKGGPTSGESPSQPQPPHHPPKNHHALRLTSLKCNKSILYYKDG